MKRPTLPADLIQLASSPALVIRDEAAMQALGSRLAGCLPSGCLVTLSGELGAGKSVLVRAIIHALGHVGRVRSPTYTLIETYDLSTADSRLPSVAHLDLYRLNDPDELEYLGFDEVLQQHALVLIEWPDKGGERVPVADVHLDLHYAGEHERRVELSLPASQV